LVLQPNFLYSEWVINNRIWQQTYEVEGVLAALTSESWNYVLKHIFKNKHLSWWLFFFNVKQQHGSHENKLSSGFSLIAITNETWYSHKELRLHTTYESNNQKCHNDVELPGYVWEIHYIQNLKLFITLLLLSSSSSSSSLLLLLCYRSVRLEIYVISRWIEVIFNQFLSSTGPFSCQSKSKFSK
jgi:hypothetical protein